MAVSSKPNYENLYVSVEKTSEKRKVILGLIQSSLSFQEDIEKLNQIRSLKKDIKEDIKKLLLDINNEYLKIHKNLPNVKNVISYNEKEVEILDRNIEFLKKEMNTDRKLIEKEVYFKKSLEGKDLTQEESKKDNEKSKEKVVSEEVENTIKRKKPATKIDRIKNNLKYIEEKLKKL